MFCRRLGGDGRSVGCASGCPSADRPCDDFTTRTGLRFHEALVAVSLSRSASAMTRWLFVGFPMAQLSHLTVLPCENIPQNVLVVLVLKRAIRRL